MKVSFIITAELIEKCGVTVEQFVGALQTERDSSEFYVQVLLSVTEYSNFIDMMKHYKREKREKAA